MLRRMSSWSVTNKPSGKLNALSSYTAPPVVFYLHTSYNTVWSGVRECNSVAITAVQCLVTYNVHYGRPME